MNSYSYTTTYTYDKANQLVSSTCDGKVTHYAYDAAGRLIKEGDKSYAYGWLEFLPFPRHSETHFEVDTSEFRCEMKF